MHLAERKFCLQCAGTRVCEHGRNRVVCVECGGNRVCRTCRVRIVLKRDSDCALCAGAKEWGAWMEARGAIYSAAGRGGDAPSGGVGCGDRGRAG